MHVKVNTYSFAKNELPIIKICLLIIHISIQQDSEANSGRQKDYMQFL